MLPAKLVNAVVGLVSVPLKVRMLPAELVLTVAGRMLNIKVGMLPAEVV